MAEPESERERLMMRPAQVRTHAFHCSHVTKTAMHELSAVSCVYTHVMRHVFMHAEI